MNGSYSSRQNCQRGGDCAETLAICGRKCRRSSDARRRNAAAYRLKISLRRMKRRLKAAPHSTASLPSFRPSLPRSAPQIDPICRRRLWLQGGNTEARRRRLWKATASPFPLLSSPLPALPSLLPSFSAIFPAYLSNTWRGLFVWSVRGCLPPACLACLAPQPPTCTKPGWERKGRMKDR